MRLLQMPALGQLEVVEVPRPEPKAGEVLVKARGAAIFRSEFIPLLRGTDVRTMEGGYLYRGFPFRFSADHVVEVAAVGPDVEGVAVGERYAVVARIAEYAVVQPDRLVRVAPDVTDEEATFPPHAGVVLNGLRKVRVQIGDIGLVIGQGPLGILAAQLLKIGGASAVIGADLYDGRLELARTCGVDHTLNTRTEDLEQRVQELTGGRGADVVVEATAAAPCVEMALAAAREHGQVVILGFHAYPFTIQKPIFNWLRKEVTVVGTFASGGSPAVSRYSAHENWQVCADLIARRRLSVLPLISHRFPFEEVQEAFRVLEDEPDTAMRVHLRFD
jgi:threonine dehydrogenase-like Zn-dependent dehydrogenase